MSTRIEIHKPARHDVDIAMFTLNARLAWVAKGIGQGLALCLIAPLLPIILLMHLVALMEPEQPKRAIQNGMLAKKKPKKESA